jgi:hypothetical protein
MGSVGAYVNSDKKMKKAGIIDAEVKFLRFRSSIWRSVSRGTKRYVLVDYYNTLRNNFWI